MSIDSALQHLLAANRVSGKKQSYATDNPNEWALVKAYAAGGARPTGVKSEMGLAILEFEDERRVPGPTGPTGATGPTGSTGPTGPSGCAGKALTKKSDFIGWGGQTPGGIHLDKISEIAPASLRYVCDFPSGSGDGVQSVDVDHLLPWSKWNGFVWDLSGYITIPAVGNPQGFPDYGDWNCLMEFGVAVGGAQFVANQIGIDGRSAQDATIYARSLTPGGGGYLKYSDIQKLSYDKKTPFRWRVVFSAGAAGSAEFWFDGRKVMNHQHPTVEPSWANPYFHMGFYSGNVVRNEVVYSDLCLT